MMSGWGEVVDVPAPQDLPLSFVSPRRPASLQDQLEQLLEGYRKQEAAGPVRVRIPLTIYDIADSRTYIPIREAAWNLQLPIEQTTPETIERLIEVIGKVIVAVATEGSETILRRIEQG